MGYDDLQLKDTDAPYLMIATRHCGIQIWNMLFGRTTEELEEELRLMPLESFGTNRAISEPRRYWS